MNSNQFENKSKMDLHGQETEVLDAERFHSSWMLNWNRRNLSFRTKSTPDTGKMASSVRAQFGSIRISGNILTPKWMAVKAEQKTISI